MTRAKIRPGYRFVLRQDVERFSDYIVPEGSTGTVTEVHDNGTIIALIDQHIDGAEAWDNHVLWDSDFMEDTLPLDSGPS